MTEKLPNTLSDCFWLGMLTFAVIRFPVFWLAMFLIFGSISFVIWGFYALFLDRPSQR